MNMWSSSHINEPGSGLMHPEKQVNICKCSSEHMKNPDISPRHELWLSSLLQEWAAE